VETDSDSVHTPERGGHGAGGHVPVLLKEAIDFLAVKRGGTYLDATVGLGGHSYEIAKRLGAPGHLIGFDKDAAALEMAEAVLSSQLSVLREGSGAGKSSRQPSAVSRQ
jgi:16S rRNA C1402 N4-methylase RsmH